MFRKFCEEMKTDPARVLTMLEDLGYVGRDPKMREYIETEVDEDADDNAYED